MHYLKEADGNFVCYAKVIVDRLFVDRQRERWGLNDNLHSANERQMEARFCVTWVR
jgi:hypothetical protein